MQSKTNCTYDPSYGKQLLEIQRSYREALAMINQSIESITEQLAALDRLQDSSTLLVGSVAGICDAEGRESLHAQYSEILADLSRKTLDATTASTTA